MCAIAYTLQVDALDRRVEGMTQVAGMQMAMGAEGVELPDPVKLRGEYDEWLAEVPRELVMDPDERTLRRALGLRGR